MEFTKPLAERMVWSDIAHSSQERANGIARRIDRNSRFRMWISDKDRRDKKSCDASSLCRNRCPIDETHIMAMST